MSRILGRIRNEVRQRANGRCEYCGLPESMARLSHQVDHVIPPRHGGSDELENLAWACFRCNNNKGTDIATVDITTNQRVWFFNPREQKWDEHFELDITGLIIGKTAEGRAIARLLDMNIETEIEARRLLIENDLW